MPVAQDQPAVDLFSPAPFGAADLVAAASSRPDTVETRSVAVNPAALDAARLRIDLFGGASLVAERVAIGAPTSGRVWNGEVPGSPQSSVTLAEVDGSIQGSIRTLDAAYSIEPLATTGTYALRQVNPTLSRPELPPQEAAIPDAAADLSSPLSDNGAIFDVLVVYNQAARSFAGSDANIRARIELGIAEANTAYANSQMVPRLRLVGAELVDYAQQPDMLVDLERLTRTADGFIDAVHARRNLLGADMVHLVIGPQTNACGIGWLMQNLSAGFAANAFSVSAYDCISPNYTLAHELAHNMGSHHAPQDLRPGDTGLYPYSFGYKHAGGAFRTVMAYNCDGGCPRVLNFSNPAVLRGGKPTGTAALHDNARSITSARLTIANWRPAADIEPPTISAIGPKATVEDTPSAPIPFTIGDPDTAAVNLTASASSSNPDLVPNTPAALALAGTGASRTLTVAPAANATGSATITVSVSDGTTIVPASFVLTVAAVNDAPVLTFDAPSASTPEGVPAESIVTVSDIDSPGASLVLSATSGNTSLLPNSGIVIAPISSTANTRTFRATMSPAAGHGVAAVSFVANDFGPAGAAVAAFSLTVLARPTLSAIAHRTIGEDTPATVALTMSDPDTAVASLSVSATSSNASLVGSSGLTVSGTGASRTLAIRPNANAHGSTTITVAVSDGAHAAVRSFVLTVTPINDAPGFHAMTVTSVTAAAGTQTTIHLAVTDPDSPPNGLTLSGTSSDNALLPSVSVTPVETTATGRLFAVTLTSAPGRTGTAMLGLTASDTQPATAARAVAVEVVPEPVAPDPPLDLTGGSSGTRITLHWFAALTGAPATTYLVEIGISPGTTTLPTQTTTAPKTTIAVDLPDGMYFVRVRGVNSAGASAPSAEAFVAIGAAALLPGPPAHFTIDTVGTSATLGWTRSAVGQPASSYVIEAGSAPGLANLVTLVTTGPVTSFAVPSVPAGTYFVRVRGRNHVGVGASSQDVSIVMGPSGQCVALPGAPVLLTPVVTGNTVSLSWNAAPRGGRAESYAIAAGSAPGLSDLARLDTGSSGTSFAARAPNGVYYVRVAATNPCGHGPASNEVSFTLGPERPRAPSGLRASVAADRQVTLTWTPPAGGAAPTAYLVQAGSSPGQSNVAVISTGSALPAFSAVAPPGEYYVRVSALNGAGLGLPSNEIIVFVP